MTNPFTLRDAVVDRLRAISALVELCGNDEANIVGYNHQWPESTSWMAALRQHRAGGIMVLYRGTSIGRWGRIPSRQHNFSLLIRDGAEASIADVWVAIIDGGFRSAGIPGIHPNVEMVQDPTFELRTMAVTDTAFLDYWEAPFALTETGFGA